MPRVMTRPWIVYAEMSPHLLPTLYRIAEFVDREDADAKAGVIRKQCRVVDVRYVPAYPIPETVEAQG